MTLSLATGLSDASTFAQPENALFFTLLWESIGIVAVLGIAAITFLVRYRHTTEVNRSLSGITEWHWELGWTSATTLAFLALFFWGARLYRTIEIAPPGTVDISVTGRQWMWDVRHPDGRREFDTLHVVISQPTRLILVSEDVIHSFFVPSFRIKQDVVPGKTVFTWFVPTQTGSYPIYCAQYCGSSHAQMTGRVIVQTQAAHDAWSHAREGSDLAVAEGHRLYREMGCAACHEAAPARGPAMAGIYGRIVHLTDGTYVQADEVYLHDHLIALHPPQVAGYPATMPRYHGLLTESQAYALIWYLHSLRSHEEGPRT